MIDALRSLFPALELEPGASIDQPTIRVPPASLVEVCRALRDRPEFGFILLADLTAVDWWPRQPRFEDGFDRKVFRDRALHRRDTSLSYRYVKQPGLIMTGSPDG